MPTPTWRQRTIETHLPLVRAVAQRFAYGADALDELVQVGAIGLIKAVDRFDPDRGAELAPYAAVSIAGEIRHHLRDGAGPVRVPRRLQTGGLRVRTVALEAATEPTTDALAGVDERVALAAAMGVLDVRERYIVALHYFGDLSQAQVGVKLGLSQVHVCRLLKGALTKLRAELATTPGPA